MKAVCRNVVSRIRIYAKDEGESPLYMYNIIENYNILYMLIISDILCIIQDMPLVQIILWVVDIISYLSIK